MAKLEVLALRVLSVALANGLLATSIATAQTDTSVTFERSTTTSPPLARTKGGAGTVTLRGMRVQPAETPEFPVQLPDDANLIRVVEFIADSDSYSATFRQPGYVLQVHGSRIVAILPQSAKLPAPDKEQYTINKTETGYEVSFSEFGAHYLVSVECKRRDDERCKKPAFAFRSAKTLVVYPAN